MSPRPARYTRKPLPAYAYTPGSGRPHPVRDPRGHSYGVETPQERFDPEHWRDSETYLYAIDLFNAGYWWEAHEALEALWLGSGRTGPAADFLRALIQLAAACLKVRSGNRASARRLLERGRPALEKAGREFAGIATATLTSAIAGYVEGSAAAEPVIRLGDC